MQSHRVPAQRKRTSEVVDADEALHDPAQGQGHILPVTRPSLSGYDAIDKATSTAREERMTPFMTRRGATRRGFFALLTTVSLAITAAAFAATAPAGAEPKPKRSVLVFGGSGQLGAEVVRALVGAGHEVTVFLRPSSSRDRLAGLAVQMVEGDALVEADIERALRARRYDAVVDALGRSESDVDFFAKSGTAIARWSAATRVRQVILHSSVGVGRSKAVYPPARYENMRRLFEAKQAGEDAVMASGADWTIIRNAVLRNIPAEASDGARLFDDETKFGAVSRRGLGRLTLECIDNPACSRKIFHAVDEGMPVPGR
jgi:uncharacterized protein YbjT (DUF2867 family)